MTQDIRARLVDLLSGLYGPKAAETAAELKRRIDAAQGLCAARTGATRRDAALPAGMLLISYGDTLREPGKAQIATLRRFLDEARGGAVDVVHAPPFHPSTSDDGFSVANWRKGDSAPGLIEALSPWS